MANGDKHHDGEKRITNNGFYALFGLITYFIWCDLSFFGELAAERINHETHNSTLVTKFTVKQRMLCHFDQYVYLPFCLWVNEYFLVSEISWVTPNLVTLIHFCVAVTCGRLFASTKLCMRRTGVILFHVRSMLDVMDGVIYRAQLKSKSKALISGWGTWGFWIDGMADTIGSLFIIIGTLYRYCRYPPLRNPYSLLKVKGNYATSDEESARKLLQSDGACSEEVEEVYGLRRYSRLYVVFVSIFLTVTVVIRSGMWDHFNMSYHNLLGVRRADIPPEKQIEVINYGSTSFCIWLWKFHSADAFLSYTLIAIFFNKLWRWMEFSAYAAIPNLIVVGLICQLNLMQIRVLLGVSGGSLFS